MSHATLVVEAAETGGALITADLAQGYDREVFAIPGRPGDETSKGCNDLIRSQRAQLVTSAEDIRYYMQWTEDAVPINKVPLDINKYPAEEQDILHALSSNADTEMHMDELCWTVQMQIGQVATILLNLELQGVVNSLPGNKYCLS